jgi:hypothetical protein
MKAEGVWSDRDQYAGAMCALHALSGALEELHGRVARTRDGGRGP